MTLIACFMPLMAWTSRKSAQHLGGICEQEELVVSHLFMSLFGESEG